MDPSAAEAGNSKEAAVDQVVTRTLTRSWDNADARNRGVRRATAERQPSAGVLLWQLNEDEQHQQRAVDNQQKGQNSD